CTSASARRLSSTSCSAARSRKNASNAGAGSTAKISAAPRKSPTATARAARSHGVSDGSSSTTSSTSSARPSTHATQANPCSHADHRTPCQRDGGLVVGGPFGQKLVDHPGSLVPTPSLDRLGQERPARTEPDEGAMAEILGDTLTLFHLGDRPIDVAEDQIHHAEVVVRPDHPGDVFRLRGKRDALFELDEPTWIAHACDSRSPHVDKRVRAKVIESELRSHGDRLPAELDRSVVVVGEHLVAR